MVIINKRKVGDKYEKIASEYLIAQGLDIIDRNFRLRSGEIDIIARDRDYLVFVEVKARTNDKMGFSLESVDYRKISQIKKVAEIYLYKNNISINQGIRFDVVGIDNGNISWIKNAF